MHREGKGKKVPDEQVNDLSIGAKMHFGRGDFDVSNVVVRNILTDRARNRQTIDITVVLTRPIPMPSKEK
jgi:hypothetical protein